MKTRQTKLFVIVFAFLALVLAACSSADPTPTAAPAATQAPEPTEVPVEEPTEEMAEEETAEEEMMESIVDIAVANEDFSTLVTALDAAGLVETLQGDGPFTVFAPTNDAFAALGEDTVAALLEDTDTLSEILLYHVVPGKVLAEDVVSLTAATTVQGEDVAISVEDGTVFVNEAAVTATDIEGNNGVIHVIDAVILPSSIAEEMAAEELPTIVDAAVVDGNFTTLVSALEAAGLVETLQGEGPFTVFAPTDEAFAALGEDTINGLLTDPEGLGSILLYHVVPGALMAEDVIAAEALTSAQGEDIAVMVDGESVMVNQAAVVVANVETANGIIHVIDAVILPPSLSEADEAELPNLVETAAAAGTFNTLLAAAEAAGLAETLQSEGPFTVFAPTDDAFATLGEDTIKALLEDPETLADILLYHVVPGEVLAADVVELTSATTLQGSPVLVTVTEEGVQINGAKVVTTDIQTSNGVIHVIDAVITPPTQSIVDIAVSDENFSTLVAALDAAGLVETLQGEGPFTVFAPTNDAFAQVEGLDAILADTELLTSILLYHVVDGAVFAGDVVELEAAPTVNGEEVTITVDEDGNVFINDAQVIITDILATNGVIHVINTVLVPAG